MAKILNLWLNYTFRYKDTAPFHATFALNLWLATYEKGRPATARGCHAIPYFIAVKRLHGAVHPPCWKPVPAQGVLRPRETFSSPLNAAVRNRPNAVRNCTKHSLLASVWTLFCSFFLFSARKHFSKRSCWLLGCDIPEKSRSFVTCKMWKWEFQCTVGSSASKTLFAGVFQPPSRAQKMPWSPSVMKTVQIQAGQYSQLVLNNPLAKNILEKRLWVIFNYKYLCELNSSQQEKTNVSLLKYSHWESFSINQPCQK